MCVQYIGGCSVHWGYSVHRGIPSVHWGDLMSTSGGYHEYIGGHHEYIGEYHEYIRDVMMHVGDIMSTLEDVQYIGVFNTN